MAKIGLNQGQVIIKDGKVLTDEQGVDCCCEVEPPGPCDPGGTYLVTISGAVTAFPANCGATEAALNATHVIPLGNPGCGIFAFPHSFSHCKEFTVPWGGGGENVLVAIGVGCSTLAQPTPDRVVGISLSRFAALLNGFYHFPPPQLSCGCPTLHPSGVYPFLAEIGGLCFTNQSAWVVSLVHG